MAKFTQKVRGRVGMKARWLDREFRPTHPEKKEVRRGLRS